MVQSLRLQQVSGHIPGGDKLAKEIEDFAGGLDPEKKEKFSKLIKDLADKAYQVGLAGIW